MRNLYLTATSAKSGKSAIALGLMSLLRGSLNTVGFFRPIISQINADWKDHDITLINTYFKSQFDYEECYACSLAEARELINAGQVDVLMEKILRKYNELAQKCDFVLCEGTDFMGKDTTFESELNFEIAANLGADLILIANAQTNNIEELESGFHANTESAKNKGADVLAYLFNMSALSIDEKNTLFDNIHSDIKTEIQLYAIPENETLTRPAISDIQKYLGARLLYGHERVDSLVSDYLVAAMQVNNFMNYIREGNLVITPADRSDIVLASLTTKLSSAYPDISGILITGGTDLPRSIRTLIDGWTGTPTPLLAVESHTFKTVSTLMDLHGRINPEDTKKINLALSIFETNVNAENLLSKILVEQNSEKKTPMMFEFQLMEQARKQRMRIVLPEGKEERVLKACEVISQRNVADIILLGNIADIQRKARDLGVDISAATIINPAESEHLDDFVNTYHELRKAKGMTAEQARDRMLDATYFGTMMVHKNLADGMVSGAINTTGHTVRPALEFIKTKPSFSIVSSVFFMCLKDRVLAFGDCAINPDPNAEQLAEIALSAADTAKTFGLEPRVALLSYSTGTSGKGVDVDKVVEATRIARERDPNLLIEGPIQYDAAIDPEVALTKLPDSKVAGRATVFIFPDLNTGNNTYKAVQRAAGAIAIGPVLQGLNKPVNDLSRGCSVADIVNTVIITAVQAQADK